MAYLGQRTFASFEKKAKGWGELYDLDQELYTNVKNWFKNKSSKEVDFQVDANEEDPYKLALQLNSTDEKERLIALRKAFSMGKNGWDFIINMYSAIYWTNVHDEINQKVIDNYDFRSYVLNMAHSENNQLGINALQILSEVNLSLKIDTAYLQDIIIAELISIKERASYLSGFNEYLIDQKDQFVEKIDNLLVYINDNSLTITEIIEIRKQINSYFRSEGELDTLLAIINLHGYNEEIPESFEWRVSNNLQDRLRAVYKQYVTAIFGEYFNFHPSLSNTLFVALDLSEQRREIIESIEPSVVRGTIEDIETQLVLLQIKFNDLIEVMQNDDSDKTEVQLKLVEKLYEKFKTIQTNFKNEANTLLSLEEIKLNKEFEDFKTRLTTQIEDFTGILMASSFAYTINTFINLQEDSWQLIDKNSNKTIQHKKTLENALNQITDIVKNHAEDPSQMIPLLQEITISSENKAAFEYFQEFAIEEEDHRMWIGLIIAIVITFLSILGGFLLQSAVPSLLSSLAVRTGSMMLMDVAIMSTTALPALAVNSLGFIVTNKLLMQALSGDGDWDNFVRDYIYTFITFGALKASGNFYKAVVNPNIGAGFYKGGQFVIELATLEGVSLAVIAWENRDLPEEEKHELFTWEGLTENAVFLLILKGSLLAVSKKGIPFIEKMNQTTRDNIMSMRKDIQFQQESLRKKKKPLTTDIEQLHNKTVGLMKLEKNGLIEVYDSGSYKQNPSPKETDIQKAEREKTDKVIGDNLLQLVKSIESNIMDMNKLISLEKYNLIPANKSGSIIYFNGDPAKLEKDLKFSEDTAIDGKFTLVSESETQRLYEYQLGENTTYFIQKSPFETKPVYPYQTAKNLGYEFKDVQRDFWQELVDNHGQPDFSEIGSSKTNLLIQQALNEGWRPGEAIPKNIMTKLYNDVGLNKIRIVETDPELRYSKENLELEIKDAEGMMKALEIGIKLPQTKRAYTSFDKDGMKSKKQWKSEQLNKLNQLTLSEYSRELFELNNIAPNKTNFEKLIEIHKNGIADRLQMHRILEHSPKQPYTNAEKTLNLIHTLATECSSVKGVPSVIGDFTKGGNFFKGAHWMLRYIDAKNMWADVKAFEVRTDTEGTNEVRRYDMKTTDGTLYQFKTWTSWNEAGVIKQLKQDIVNTKGGLQGIKDGNLKWVFEETSLGNYQAIKAKFIKAIEKLPDSFNEMKPDLIKNVDKIIEVGL